MVQPSHLYMTTKKKNIALTIRNFVGKVMSLLFNRLSRFVTAFLTMSKLLLIFIVSHSIVFLYFFALITEEGYFISPCYQRDSQESSGAP